MRCLARYQLIILVAALVPVGPARALRADDQDEARTIIAKAIKAHGGEEKLTRLPAETYKESGTFYGRGQAFPYNATVSVHYPERAKIEIENVYTAAVDGDRGWITLQGSTNDLPKDRLDESKEGQYADWVATLVPLKEKEFKLALLGETVVGTKPALGLRVSRKDHRDVSLYFDKASGLLVKTEKRVKQIEQGGEEATQETTFQEFEDVQGTKIARKVVTKRDGKDFLESLRTEIKRLEKLDDSLFAKP